MNQNRFQPVLFFMAAMFALAGFDGIFGCASCVSGYSQSQLDAYLTITLFLIALPLISATFIFFYVRKKMKLNAVNIEKENQKQG